MMARRCLLSVFVLSLLGLSVWAQEAYVIRNARIVPVSGEVIERGSVVIRDGKIADIGPRVSRPSGSRSIEGRGLTVYPGLFDSLTQVGLTEVGASPVTNDYSEMGDFMPHLMAFSAIHVESEHIPVARVDGITHVLTVPSGGTIAGQGALISLAGWNQEDMEVRRSGAMMMSFPSLLPLPTGFSGFGRGRSQSNSERKKAFEAKIKELKLLLAKARHYMQAKESGVNLRFDRQLDALIPVLQGKLPVVIEANSHVDIKAAVEFAQEEKLNYLLSGARDAWRVAEFLKENDVRVILGPVQALPVRDDDPYDIVYRTPAILHENGVKFAMSTGGSSDVRTLPFEVGNAVGYGLPYEVALRSITLTPAEFFGIEDQLGSLEKGKIANLVVADGDILEYQTRIQHVFINGQPVVLESKHTKLYDKYANRP